MNPDRYVRISENVYIDRWGGQPPNSSPSWAETLMILFFLGVIGAVFMPVFKHQPRESNCRRTCPSGLKQIGLAVAQYCQDNNDKYPIASVDGEIPVALGNGAIYGWGDALQPYLKSVLIYHCPINSARQTENDISGTQHYSTQPTYISYTDYWLNQNLCAMPITILKHPAATFLSGDGNNGDDTTTARYALRALPITWRDNPTAPIRRHNQAANYLFADGHVKSFAAGVVTESTFSRAAFSLQGLTKSQLEP